VLDGQDVLPGFSVRLRDLFQRLASIQEPLAAPDSDTSPSTAENNQ
jgi:hypothetical protein